MKNAAIEASPSPHAPQDDGETKPARSATLQIVPWVDPIVDGIGFDPRSSYVETFWLPALGPSATWLLRRLADRLELEPEGFTFDLDDGALLLGLGTSASRHAPVRRALDRCLRYGMARSEGMRTIEMRQRVPALPRRYLLRLPIELQALHRDWEATTPPTDAVCMLRRRARLLALDLLDLRLDVALIERHLVRRGVHPAMAFEAAHWAGSDGDVEA